MLSTSSLVAKWALKWRTVEEYMMAALLVQPQPLGYLEAKRRDQRFVALKLHHVWGLKSLTEGGRNGSVVCYQWLLIWTYNVCSFYSLTLRWHFH